jgi:DNA-binding MarR family transcriptional regulator
VPAELGVGDAVASQPDVHDVAAAIRASVGLLLRRLRQVRPAGELSLPENSAMVRLERSGPMTPSALARLEQISPQSVGATIAALESRGLVERRQDPSDGRRILLSVTESGLQALRDKGNARVEQLARALSSGFTARELEQLHTAAPLIERLAQNI